MPYENDDCSTTKFADQLIVIEDICNANSDCHVIADGDFNVDFTRDGCHTLLLDNFCESVGLNHAVRHRNSNVDYTYHFDLDRFSVLDHFFCYQDLSMRTPLIMCLLCIVQTTRLIMSQLFCNFHYK
jgi:hypothetical protein